MSRPPFSRRFDVGALPALGHVERLVASEEERAALAAEWGIIGLPRIEAELRLKPWRSVGVKVEGRLRAEAVQACVVTLDPVGQTIDEPFEATFMPEGVLPRVEPGVEIEVTLSEEDPPEPFDGRQLDLGALVAEHLSLALDPYPRVPGAVFDDEPPGQAPEDSPFAALSALRRGGSGQD
ncbi:DUF177 domain-containing protein [Prosthecomicrobium pneumaticum]|uniref:Uncharacterized metal-binding protein YceD (DUF177 family) n=1 Tax=Prosthecomicrobium pneumaticum TaxID=81895 RepID=A0A7W9FQ87_9HYPH|nr:DUF177 domain-containing protein [Prosthecomicrobium pneumaticum]MBB5754771.1 uncharacterized metal-binding protein YceD (DUF177 family) [Prosthecomicrobium pneumaticum]